MKKKKHSINPVPLE